MGRYDLFKRFLYFSVLLLAFCNPVPHDCLGAACTETEKKNGVCGPCSGMKVK